MPASPTPVDTPRRLNGWKEIAAYLDHGVRTVQRWEKDFGMPVHRRGTGRSEGVVAFAHEIDAWQTTPLADRARAAGADGVAESSTARPTPLHTEPLFDRVWLIRMSATALLTAVMVVLLWAAGVRWQVIRYAAPGNNSAPGAAPAAWHIDLDTLVVSDATGNLLWKHRFPFPLHSAAYRNPPFPERVPAGIEDLDGDGLREVWFVSSPELATDWHNHQLFLFNSDGKTRWTYQFAGEVRFGADSFGPPWPVRGVFLTADPGGTRERALWAASNDRLLFPAVLQRLDLKTGAPLSTYWSNGYILALALFPADGRPTLLVGAANNEKKAGSLAVLDARSPNGSAPAERDAYRCTSCPPGQPGTFLVFPKPKRFGNADFTSPVVRIERAGGGGFHVNVVHGVGSTGPTASAVYTLDGSFRPVSASAADGYTGALRAMARDGTLPPGGLDPVDPDREFLPISRWDATSRHFVEVPRAPSAR